MVNMGVFGWGVLLAMSLVPCAIACGWINNWDQPLNFRCPHSNQFISHIESVHHNHYEDRRFKMSCSNVPHVSRCETKCFWTGYLNDWDRLLFYHCGRHGYINGMHSVHHNHYEDRRWKIRCCTAKGLFMNECDFTGWTNYWDGYQRYTAPRGQVTSGILSVHDNHREDRRYRYRVCKPKRIHDSVAECAQREQSLADRAMQIFGKRIQDEGLDSFESLESPDSLESPNSLESPDSRDEN